MMKKKRKYVKIRLFNIKSIDIDIYALLRYYYLIIDYSIKPEASHGWSQ